MLQEVVPLRSSVSVFPRSEIGTPITKAAASTVFRRSASVCDVSGVKLLLDNITAGGTRTHPADYAGVCTIAERSLRCPLSAAYT